MLDHYTTPGESIEIRDNQTIYSLLTDRLARTGADTVIAAKKIGPGRWQNVTTGEFHERVVSAAKGLIALGIAKGDAVTIFSSTRLEWGILDFALAAVGAVSVPIYDTDSAPQAQRIMIARQGNIQGKEAALPRISPVSSTKVIGGIASPLSLTR